MATASGGASGTGTGTSTGGGGTLAAWFASTLARIQTYDATLTDVVVQEEFGAVVANWDPTAVLSGTFVINAPSSLDLQSGATAGGSAILTLKDHATITGLDKVVVNMKTSHYAIAARVTKIATIATSTNRMCTLTDGAGVVIPQLGMIGATSVVNYSVKAGSSAAVDTGVAQSAVGTYDTLILLNDGTNLKVDINGAAPGSGASNATTNVGATFGIPSLTAIQAAAANSGFRIDKYMVVVAPAS